MPGWLAHQPAISDKDELVSNNGVVFGVAAIGEHVVTYGGRWGGQLLDEGASSDKLIIKEVVSRLNGKVSYRQSVVSRLNGKAGAHMNN